MNDIFFIKVYYFFCHFPSNCLYFYVISLSTQCDVLCNIPQFPKNCEVRQALEVEGESDFTSMTVVSKHPGQQ